jgi:Protein of unknown function (DUF3306)
VADGFLGRWSRRKLDAKDGRPLEPEPAREAKPDVPAPQPSPAPSPQVAEVEAAPAPEPPPTLEDVRSLTADSDFSRFVRADVSPDVKNAAVKKLFSDPHFNVMDGLDTYIDDYTKADPIPESMLKQLTAGRFLGLFREEEEERKDETGGPQPRDVAEGQASESVAQSEPPAAEPAPAPSPAVPPESHAHPDLRLQQDDAARPGEAGRSTG